MTRSVPIIAPMPEHFRSPSRGRARVGAPHACAGPMRWTSPVRLVFLLPAVAWVLAFTVFPLGYSLYLAFFKIESKVEVTREKVPVLDEQGEPVLLSSGKPRERTIVSRSQVDTSTFVGAFNFQRLLDDPQVADRDPRDRDVRADRGAGRARAGFSAGAPVQPAARRHARRCARS